MQTSFLFRIIPAGVAVGALLLAGCATTPRLHPLSSEIQSPPADPAVVAKVEKRKPLSIPEIEHTLEQGASEATLLDYVKDSRATYRLTAEEVDRLREASASNEFVDYLLATPVYHAPPSYYRVYYPYSRFHYSPRFHHRSFHHRSHFHFHGRHSFHRYGRHHR